MALSERGQGAHPEIPQLYYLDTGLPVKYPVLTGLKEELRTEENLFPPTSEQKSKAVREYLDRARKRTTFKGFGSIVAFDLLVSTPILQTGEAIYTGAIDTLIKATNPQIVASIFVPLIIAATAGSIYIETKAFKNRNACATGFGMGFHTTTGNRLFSAIADHGINFINVGTLNVVNAYAIITHDFSKVGEAYLATPLVLASWYAAVNSTIAWGDRIVNPVKKDGKIAWGKIKHAIKG
jgi:hypothetical protein